jgi:hypothetical protein
MLGQALLWRPVQLTDVAIVAAGLSDRRCGRRYGGSYEAYRRAVPAWMAAAASWRPDGYDRA